MSGDPAPFSRRVAAADIPAGGREIAIEASPVEREALARDFRLRAIDRLAGRFNLTRTLGGVAIEGEIEGRVTQICVATLEPFQSDIREEIALTYSDTAQEADSVVELSLDAPDPPEQLVDGTIDLGALAAEFLALGLDPYPRKPGAGPVEHRDATSGDSPFAGLGDLLKKRARVQ